MRASPGPENARLGPASHKIPPFGPGNGNYSPAKASSISICVNCRVLQESRATPSRLRLYLFKVCIYRLYLEQQLPTSYTSATDSVFKISDLYEDLERSTGRERTKTAGTPYHRARKPPHPAGGVFRHDVQRGRVKRLGREPAE